MWSGWTGAVRQQAGIHLPWTWPNPDPPDDDSNRVPELVLCILERHPLGQWERGRGMAQVVEAHVGRLRPAERVLGSAGGGRRVMGLAEHRRVGVGERDAGGSVADPGHQVR